MTTTTKVLLLCWRVALMWAGDVTMYGELYLYTRNSLILIYLSIQCVCRSSSSVTGTAHKFDKIQFPSQRFSSGCCCCCSCCWLWWWWLHNDNNNNHHPTYTCVVYVHWVNKRRLWLCRKWTLFDLLYLLAASASEFSNLFYEFIESKIFLLQNWTRTMHTQCDFPKNINFEFYCNFSVSNSIVLTQKCAITTTGFDRHRKYYYSLKHGKWNLVHLANRKAQHTHQMTQYQYNVECDRDSDSDR